MHDTKNELIIILLPNNSTVLITDPTCTQRHSAKYRLSLHNSTVLITDPTCTQRHSAEYRQPAYNGTVLNTDSLHTTAQCWIQTQPTQQHSADHRPNLHTTAQCWIQTACIQWHSADHQSYAHDIRTRNRYQFLVAVNWYQNLAPVFGTSCRISGKRNKYGRQRRRNCCGFSDGTNCLLHYYK